MSGSLNSQFQSCASKCKRPAPFSLRLSDQEKADLLKRAGGQRLGSYIKSQLFGDKSGSRNAALNSYQVAQILASLGQTQLNKNLQDIAEAAAIGAIQLSEEERASLRGACDAVSEMRALLILALGLRKSKP